jgi:hypothetical protein
MMRHINNSVNVGKRDSSLTIDVHDYGDKCGDSVKSGKVFTDNSDIIEWIHRGWPQR